MKYCIECKENAVFYYRSMFCEECIKEFFEGGKEMSKDIRNMSDAEWLEWQKNVIREEYCQEGG